MKTLKRIPEKVNLTLSLICFIFVVFFFLTAYLIKVNKLVHDELQGARNLIQLSNDRIDLLEKKNARLEAVQTNFPVNCNLTIDQAALEGKTTRLIGSIQAGPNPGNVYYSMKIPRNWCNDQNRGAYFYNANKKYYMILSTLSGQNLDLPMLSDTGKYLPTGEWLTPQILSKSSSFQFPSPVRTFVVNFNLPLANRKVFVDMANSWLSSIRQATDEEVGMYREE